MASSETLSPCLQNTHVECFFLVCVCVVCVCVVCVLCVKKHQMQWPSLSLSLS